MLNITDYNIKKGDVLICIIYANAYLTLNKEYIAERDITRDGILIKNDIDYNTYYNKSRFIPKVDLRNFNIDLITKENG